MGLELRHYDVPCRPPLWARGGHAQTLMGHLLPSPGQAFRPGLDKQHIIELDGDDRLLAYERGGSSGVRVHLFHGLSGDANSEYMRRTALALSARGHGIWAVNHRGCGDGFGMAAKTYHSGKTADMRAVLARSRELDPDLLHLVLGFSLSGNMALLLAAQGLEPLPDGLIAVNPPIDLARTSVDIGVGMNRLYQRRFMHRLRRAIDARREAGLSEKRYEIPSNLSLCEFDDLFTAPEHGFENGADYYKRCSSRPHLESIRTPAVLLTAADDPFVDPSVLPADALPWVHVHVEPYGGHVGYLERAGLRWRRWLDSALVHYVDELACAAKSLSEARQT